MVTFPVVVLQRASWLLSPVIHSALMSEYIWTLWPLPSFEDADTARYENGIDWFTKSAGCNKNDIRQENPQVAVKINLNGAEECDGKVDWAGRHHKDALGGCDLCQVSINKESRSNTDTDLKALLRGFCKVRSGGQSIRCSHPAVGYPVYFG